LRSGAHGALDTLRDSPMIRSFLIAGALALVAHGAQAADARAGRQKVAGVCQACHGMDGLSKNPESPNLAGQIPQYLVKAINGYRDGTRKNESMNIVAKELTDEDIANIAAYYSSIQVDVIPP
jgi:cytochrome c553